ncbi:MAG TPA: hypothetical protein VGB13_04660 [Candidatus Krumholzibacteria bacterium]
MGREIRRVPPDWEHPRDPRGRYIPLSDGRDYHEDAALWLTELAAWEAGTHRYLTGEGLKDGKPWTTKSEHRYWWDYDGPPPEARHHMLVDVPESECTHYQLYETTSEGTPHHDCPVFATLGALIDWAAEQATTFGGYTATREEWEQMLTPGNFVHHAEAMPDGTKVVLL